jgi:tRNA nucleotidyltransferase (CCA-adding enzyme)
VGIRGTGPTLASALEQAALALTAVVVDPARVEPRATLEVECRAESPEGLLYEWIAAVVYEMSARSMVFGEFDVRVDGGRLAARLRGEPVEPVRHEPAVEVKGPTYTELRVHRDDTGRWTAQCVVDV